jgi:hypothetical protein
MGLRLVRGYYENTHGYRCPLVARTSSGPSHDAAFLTMGAPYARNVVILEVTEIPDELLKYGQFNVKLAYCTLAGAVELGFNNQELLGIIEREMREPTYGREGVYA